MKSQNIFFLLALIALLLSETFSFRCDRVPVGVTKPRNRNDAGRYIIDIPGNPQTYSPNQRYNISLTLNPLSMTHRTFKSFIITLEQELSYSILDNNLLHATGHFEFGDDMLSKFSDRCPNTVIEANSLPKSEIKIFWIAPPPNSGCVAIKATVIESRENWFSEDGPLTKVLCEESSENENVQPNILKRCCACEEAKYEVAFEGLWTRNTHPRDFPSDVWSTKFSDVIGASHKLNNAFWKYGDIASDGLKELATLGSTKSLENELKESSENIRTIIKARGLQYPNITLSTFAVFRVDNQNHLVSLVSKLNPSPDWIVGVSNFELCRSDCTWEESRVLNLFPWDAGVDDGPSYISPNEPSIPRQPIRRIRSNSPNDPRSPFYDETGEDMKPIAKLYLTRQRVYEKVCDEALLVPQEEDGNEIDDQCGTTDWMDWSPCSAVCGSGVMFRQREYLNPDNARNCDRIMVQKEDCFGQSRHCENGKFSPEQESGGEEEQDQNGDCEVSDWGEWSSCSASCGKGTRTRDRKLKIPRNVGICGVNSADLQQNEECEGDGENCDDFEEPEINEDCPEVIWGEWTSCNVTCGTGFKVRYRIPTELEEEENNECENLPEQETVECYEPSCDEEGTENLFGNINSGNHLSPHIINQGPDGEVLDCKVTRWQTNGECELNGARCGRGFKQQVRHIRVHVANGGKPCPRRMEKKVRCEVPCGDKELEDLRETYPTWAGPVSPAEDAECIMGRWSAWSPCSTNCGGTAVQQRTRAIRYQPPGVVCPSRLDQKRCPLPLACTSKGLNLFGYTNL